jgi:hypothetical protein
LLGVLFVFAAHLSYADCLTYLYGSVNGNPNDTGASGSWYSTAYRLNGNEVYMYSNTGVTGVNAGLVITHVISYYYRNASLVRSDRGDSTAYGGTVTETITQPLYGGGQYFLGTLQLGNPSGYRNNHWGTSPVCGITNDNDPYVTHYYDSSNTYVAFKPTIQVTGDQTGATRWAFWYLGGAPSIDGYYVQLALTGHTNWGIDTSPLTWTAILGADKINTYPNTGPQVMVTSLAPSALHSAVYDVAVQISTDGLPSDGFPLYIDTPRSANTAVVDTGDKDLNGYYVVIGYTPLDNLDYALAPITMHETFENRKDDFADTDWATPSITSGVPDDWDAVNHNRFFDRLWASGYAKPPADNYNPNGNTLVLNLTQKWWLGTANYPLTVNTFTGSCIRLNKTQYYQDHAGLTVQQTPANNAACAAGQFVN